MINLPQNLCKLSKCITLTIIETTTMRVNNIALDIEYRKYAKESILLEDWARCKRFNTYVISCGDRHSFIVSMLKLIINFHESKYFLNIIAHTRAHAYTRCV